MACLEFTGLQFVNREDYESGKSRQRASQISRAAADNMSVVLCPAHSPCLLSYEPLCLQGFLDAQQMDKVALSAHADCNGSCFPVHRASSEGIVCCKKVQHSPDSTVLMDLSKSDHCQLNDQLGPTFPVRPRAGTSQAVTERCLRYAHRTLGHLL